MEQTITPAIKVTRLTVQFGSHTVLNHLDCTIPPGAITVILGGSGSGKSTLLRSILGLLTPRAGVVEILGQNRSELSEEEQKNLLTRLGVLFQNGALLNSLTVGENIAVPLEQHTDLPANLVEKIVAWKLHQVGLPHAATLFPDELSGGMRKRVALARALALDPQLLFCDEPSAGLDPVTTRNLDTLLLRLKNELGMTLVVVTHEVASIQRIADHLLFLEKGKIVFSGSLTEAKNCSPPSVRDFWS